MTDINVTFCRRLLSQVAVDVAKAGYKINKDASVIESSGYWFFEGPEDFYFECDADNAYDARYKGWTAFLKKKGVEGYADKNE